MKSVTVQRGPSWGMDNPPIHVYAVNAENEGLFHRRENDGAYKQILGTSQYHASSRRAFILSLRKRGHIRADDEVIDSYGW